MHIEFGLQSSLTQTLPNIRGFSLAPRNMSTTTAPPVWGPTFNYKIQEQQDREHMHG